MREDRQESRKPLSDKNFAGFYDTDTVVLETPPSARRSGAHGWVSSEFSRSGPERRTMAFITDRTTINSIPSLNRLKRPASHSPHPSQIPIPTYDFAGAEPIPELDFDHVGSF